MKFELPALPCAKDALEPHLSAKALEFHYERHHRGYLEKLRGLIEGTPDEHLALADLVIQSSGAVFSNAAQVWNHTLYWNSMAPDGGGEPSGRLGEAIVRSFGSLAAFREEFVARAASHDGRVGARVLSGLPESASAVRRGVRRPARELGVRTGQPAQGHVLRSTGALRHSKTKAATLEKRLRTTTSGQMSEVEDVAFGGPTRWFRLSICLLSLALLGACATDRVPPLNAMDRTVDLQRFMGDWYVIGFIPITLPFLSEDGAHNGVESYRLTDEGVIETTYTFRDSGFDGPEKRFTPKGWVHDHETNAEWRMQFLWPFKSAYLIVYLDEDYQKTIIGVPDRSNVWIMSRNPQMSDAEYQRMLRYTASLGYDVAKVKRVPQRWPAE